MSPESSRFVGRGMVRVHVLAIITALLLWSMFAGMARAGTTGSLAGIVKDATTGKPVASAIVSAVSPSQTARGTTDAAGRFVFLSLAPDTYTVSVSGTSYATQILSGITVLADQSVQVSAALPPAMKVIGTAQTRSGLVRAGQTADVYTVSGTAVANAAGLSGGGGINQTYSALATVPGVYVPLTGLNQGQNNTAPYIRGGNFTQVSTEYDGVPINRAFDSYVANTQGITGQQELQVYTGGGTASSANESLSGYVNQVIKTGTYPGFVNLEVTGGSPSAYEFLRFEAGGASQNRLFSWYVGISGSNQSYLYADNFNGGMGINPYSSVLLKGPNGTAITLPYAVPWSSGSQFIAGTASMQTRENVVNLHFGIPHKHGTGADDIQVLASIGRQLAYAFDSVNNLGGLNSPFWQLKTGGVEPTLPTGEVYNGAFLSPYSASMAKPYYYPQSNGNNAIAPNYQGSQDSNNALYKIQYQKNFSDSAYLRLYAYNNSSTWYLTDPIGYNYLPIEYEQLGLYDNIVRTYTTGVNMQFVDQLTAQNALEATAAYSTATSLRSNDTTMGNSGIYVQLRTPDGSCYSPTTGAQVNCYSGYSLANGFTIKYGSAAPTIPALPGTAPATAQYVVGSTGYNVTLNQVQPKFGVFSLDDLWNPSDRWTIDAGLRYDTYTYQLANTSQQPITGGSNAPEFAEFNAEHCFNPNSIQTLTITTVTPNAACPAGQVHTDLSNVYNGTLSHNILEPRFSGTYKASPNDVIRFSAGQYSQASRAAYVQYNFSGVDLPATLAKDFLLYGFNTPAHDIPPQISNNYDLSYEKRLKKAPLSFSLSPFYRLAENQTQAFYLDPTSNFQSGLDVGTLRAYGVEFLAQYGNFEKDGFSGQLAFTYTNSAIRYNDFSGTARNVIDVLNGEILAYNALTRAGGGSPCYNSQGTGVALSAGACPGGTLANPYYAAPLQAGLDRNGWYAPYNVVPAGTSKPAAEGSSVSYDVPYNLTMTAQWRHHGWRVAPAVQLTSGFKYGSPFAWAGYNPSSTTCFTGGMIDTTQCNQVFRPDPYTGKFDTLGQYDSPTALNLSVQIAKDVSKNITISGIFSNVYTHCYTHGYPWETAGTSVCAYGLNPDVNASGGFLGNASNGKQTSPLQNDPYGYAGYNSAFPLNVYVSVQFRNL